jgi:hypothetical protein
MPRRKPAPRPPLTIELVLAWADAHHARTGKRPSANSGPVVEAPDTTWNAVNMALVLGHRGFPGGSSLARLLNSQRPQLAQIQRSWTAVEDRQVRTLPPQVMARQTGRSLQSVYQRRRQLGVRNARSGSIPRGWTTAEDEMIRTLPVREVVRRTGRCRASVYMRRYQLGMGRRRNG